MIEINLPILILLILSIKIPSPTYPTRTHIHMDQTKLKKRAKKDKNFYCGPVYFLEKLVCSGYVLFIQENVTNFFKSEKEII